MYKRQDTNCWYFSGGTGAPAIELIYVFCKKLGIDTGVNMEAVAKINTQLKEIRKELEISVFGKEKPMPKPFNPLTDELPKEIDAEFDRAIKAAQADDEETLLDACHKIEAHFGFPAPNELVKKAEIPGGMFSNMLKQLKDAGKEDKLDEVLAEIPRVREDAGYPPLVTPTSQIVGTQAVFNVILGERYKMVTKEFKGLVHGDYGKTPAPIKKEFSDFILKGEEPITCRFADTLAPEMDKLKAEAAKYAIQEEDVLTYAMFPQVAPKFFEKRNAKAQGVDADHADFANKSHPV